MRLRRSGAVVAAVALAGSAGITFSAVAAAADAAPDVQITEFEYNTSEFVELTNVGDAAQDFTGWSFDDGSAVAGSFSIAGFGVVQPGESVVVSEVSADAFRAEWGLAPSVKVVGGNDQRTSATGTRSTSTTPPARSSTR